MGHRRRACRDRRRIPVADAVPRTRPTQSSRPAGDGRHLGSVLISRHPFGLRPVHVRLPVPPWRDGCPWPTGLRSSGTSRTPPPSSGSTGTSSSTARWSAPPSTLGRRPGRDAGRRRTVTANFLYSCAATTTTTRATYRTPRGHRRLQGTPVVHPQFWPDDLDYRQARGGDRPGATAVTLIPAMAPDVEHITMLQRSPTWISPLPAPTRWPIGANTLPPRTAHRLIRAKNIGSAPPSTATAADSPNRQASCSEPAVKELRRAAVAEHFTPMYNVWDQRVCVAPDGDLFAAINRARPKW